MSIPVIDASRHPILRVTFGPELSVDDATAYREQFLAVFEKRGPVLLICELDAWDTKTITPVIRKKLAEDADFFAHRKAFIAEYIVIKAPLLRALYTGYTWVRSRKSHPMKVFGTYAEADREARIAIGQRQAA